MRTRLKVVVGLVFFLIFAKVFANVGKITAQEVMDAVDARYEGDTRKQIGTLTLIDKDKNKRFREVAEWMKKYGLDEKTFTRVLSPSEVGGTTILSYEWDDRTKDDETWLYLPELRKVKRLAVTDKSSYFLGSDFTYSDLTGIEIKDFNYQFSEDNEKELTNGLWVVMAEPRTEIADKVVDETGYVKIKYWIDQEKKMIVKAKYWLKEDGKIKYYSASDIQKYDAVWVAKKAQMVLTQNGNLQHASIFEINDIEFNRDLEDNIFTTYAMEKRLN